MDGNKIPLSIYHTTSKTCYYYTHGGGMSMYSSREEPFTSTFNHVAGKHGMCMGWGRKGEKAGQEGGYGRLP